MFLQVTRNLLSTRGLTAAQTAAEGKAVAEEEEGEWRYLVVDSSGIRARSTPSYDKAMSEKRGRHVAGDVVTVDRRRKAGWTRWLRVKGGTDWLFDVSPKDNRVRMKEVEVLTGEWFYEVLKDTSLAPSLAALQGLEGKSRPRQNSGTVTPLSPNHNSHTPLSPLSVVSSPTSAPVPSSPFSPSTALQSGDLVTVVERVRPLLSKGAYVRLAQGGWALDFNGQQQLRRLSDEGERQEEPLSRGEWDYIVLDPKGITLRTRACYEKAAKLQARLEEGQLVKVTERRSEGLTTFLHVREPDGWAFDQAAGSKAYLRMAEAHVEAGNWWYHVVDSKGCGLRSKCSTSNTSRCGFGPQKGALVQVVQRVKVGDTMFLQLPDRNWIFDRKNGKRIIAGPCEVQERNNLISKVIAERGIKLLEAPTDEAWAKSSLTLLFGAQITVDLMVQLDGVWWSHVRRSQGSMEGWTPASGLDLPPNVRSEGAARWCAC